MNKLYKHYREVDMKTWRWPNFSPREIASKREGEILVNERALDKLQALRNKLKRPILLTSAYRSKAHNAAIDGAKFSEHMNGNAFDCRMENQNPQEFEAAARSVGFTSFGYYVKSGFMHIDDRPDGRTWGVPFPKTATALAPEAKIVERIELTWGQRLFKAFLSWFGGQRP